MPASSSFDRFFLNLPPLDKEDDFDIFWQQEIESLDKIPIDPVLEINKSASNGAFEFYNVSFKGSGKSAVRGMLMLPKGRKKQRVIAIIPDYNQLSVTDGGQFDDSLAYFILQLRGHELLKNNAASGSKEDMKTPGYMSDNLLDKNLYYVKGIYLDAYRISGMLRLLNMLECSSIGIIGKGFGASAAAFAAAFSDRISCAVLDAPSFCYLELGQNISKSPATMEINSFISDFKSKKKQIKSNLSYFDSINFSGKIKCPVLVTAGLKDVISPPECVLALFNHLLCEKTAEIYPEDGNSAGGPDQMKKSINWIKNILLSE